MIVPASLRTIKTFLISLSTITTLELKLLPIFFASSHGKSPWIGVGGAIKRKLSKESLTRTNKSQIISPKEAYDYCVNCIKGVQFFYSSKNELVNVRKSLQERYEGGCTVSGMRSFHVFIPKQIGIIAKRTAKDGDFSEENNFF